MAGFTLLEIIVVLAILGLTAGLVVTRGPYRSPTLDLHRAAGEITEALRSARGQAIARDRRVTLTMDVATHAVVVGDAVSRPLPNTVALGFVAVSGEAANSPNIGISFASDGSSSGGTISLASGAHELLVVVDWLTGRITIADAGSR